MNFTEAKLKLNEIAGGSYHSMTYNLVDFGDDGVLVQECSVYIDGYGIQTAQTWQTALALMEEVVTPVIDFSEIESI